MRRALLPFVVGLLVVTSGAADDAVPVPPVADQDKAEKLIRSLFKAEFAKTTPKARAALATKLIEQAAETGTDPAAQFVLYREGAELAAAAGETDLTLQAVDALRARFTGLKADYHEALFKMLAAKTANPEGHLALAGYLLRLTDDAVTADDLDAAARLVKLAESAATKGKSVRTASAAATRAREVEAFKKDAPAVLAAKGALLKNVNDPAASTTLGGYYCFQKGEWERGLSLLANGADAKLKAVALKEAADPEEATALLAVADGWYDAGAAAAGPAKRAMLARSFTFYSKAAPDLTGLNKAHAEKRVEELEKTVEGKGPNEELFAAVRAQIRAGDFAPLPPLGGFLTRKDFRDAAPNGGVLIGFRYTTKSFNGAHDVMDFLQPIYATPLGEKPGAAYGGKAPPGVQTVKAKHGYAVGALRVRGGGLLEGMSVQFMRIQGKGLNPADAYESPWLGRTPAPPPGIGPTVGDSRPVFGIHGKLRADGNEEVCQIGLIVAGKTPPKKK